MNDLTILHLSDLHINFIDSDSMTRRMKELIKDIKTQTKYSQNIIIIVTGDLVDKANYTYSDGVRCFFEKLKEGLGTKFADIVIVPGNHDRKMDEATRFLNNACRSQRDNKLDEEWKESYWGYYEKGFEDFIQLRNSIYDILGVHKGKENAILREKTYGVKVKKLDGDKVLGLILLNSAWCTEGGDGDRRNLRIGQFQTNEIRLEYNRLVDEQDVDLTIAIAHHPSNWLMDCEEDLLLMAMNSADYFNADIYMCGHTHNRDVINWYNNRKSLTTLVSGLGWPEESETQHTDVHTYSMYVFNLEINSIDIYVRSTNEGGEFEPDFRIYTNEKDKKLEKLVFPIKLKSNEGYFELGTSKKKSNKQCYINQTLMDYMKRFVLQLCEFRENIANQIMVDCNDFWEAVKVEDESADKNESDKDKLFELLFSNLPENKLEVLQRELKGLFTQNEVLLYSNFDAFLVRVCAAMSECFLEDDFEEDEIVRFHFRYCASRNTYKKLCAVYPEFELMIKMRDHDLSEIQWGELIKASYEVKKPLIYSVNSDECTEHELNEKWNNFITVIPIDERYNYNVTKRIQRPLITFGITSSTEKYDSLFYLLDYFQIDKILVNVLNSYMKRFPIDMDKFIAYTNKQKECKINGAN